MTKVWVHSCTRTREQEFILKYFYFHLLSYRVDKTRFSSSGAARDCYVHLDVSPTFQFDLKKFLNVWNAILIYITLDVFVVNVLPCHVIHDEQRKNLDWETCAGHATRVGWSGKDYFLGVKAIPFNIYPPPPSRPALQGHGKLYFWWGGCVGTVELWSIPESRGMGKEPRPDHSGGGTGSVALREGDGKCWIALSFRRKSTRAPICRRRPFDRLEIIIGQGSLARTDNHERKNVHVILKLLYTTDPSALVCVLWIVTTIWLASFWSIYRVDSTVNKDENEDNWS